MEDGVLTNKWMKCGWVLCAFLCWIAPLNASAQADDSALEPGEVAFLTSSTSAMPFLGISTTAGIYIRRRKAWLRDEIKLLDTIALLDSYITENEPGVRMSIAMGAGGELDEIALILGVEHQLDAAAREQLRARRHVIFAEHEEESSRGWMMYFAIQDVIAEPAMVEVRR
jgi:hypothetical protein